MSLVTRRSFFASSLAGLTLSPLLFARDDNTEVGKKRDDEVGKKIVDDPQFQPATLFLTWRRDPTTTMIVQWVGTQGETSDSRIHYRAALTNSPVAVASLVAASARGPDLLSARTLGVYPWQIQPTQVMPYPMSDFKVFRAELSGLQPGTDYEFRIGKRSPIYRFQTMPAKATDTIHFISGGDCGFNAHTVANNQQAAKQDPMFAVIGGDLGYDNGRSVEISLAFLHNYSKHMVGRNGRLIPMIAGIGNHEVDGGYGQPRSKAPFFCSLFDGLYPETVMPHSILAIT
jgi:hypothetical protein